MHIGSITKIFNATLVMQLVDEHIIRLERPVIEYLPDLKLGDRSALEAITVEQLINHTSGIDANLLPDAGHDQETIEKTVQRFGSAGQVHAPGAARSYCNAGTVIAGYLCQRLTGRSWYDLIKERIFAPLEMEHAVVLPEDALLHRWSVGHFVNSSTGEVARTTQAFLPLGYSPAGSTAMMSAADLLLFIRAHLNGGTAKSGKRILSAENTARMRAPSGNLTGISCFDGGLGWMFITPELVHHGGGGPGILSWFIADPATKSIAVMLTNSENGFSAINDVIGSFAKAQFGCTPFPELTPQENATIDEPARYVGEYENNTTVHAITSDGRNLFWSARASAQYADASSLEGVAPIPLFAAGNEWFIGDIPGAQPDLAPRITIRFARDNSDRMNYLIHSYRMHRLQTS
jgi:CubicO group peptidase (beta-lactamase class C family)